MNDVSEDILATARAWHAAGRQVAIATVIETWGSAPRPSGSQLVVDEACRFQGSVSGGCVESAVISEALEVIRTQTPRLLEFGVTNEMAWEVGLACGGRISIYVEPLIQA
jgi:xanthine/CO dehydrogenase XdhC/CoxF family maturation factor